MEEKHSKWAIAIAETILEKDISEERISEIIAIFTEEDDIKVWNGFFWYDVP